MKDTRLHWNWISNMRLAAASGALAFSAALVLAVITTQPAQAQTFTTLAGFDGTDGSSPLAPLVQATNGNLYGTTNQFNDGSGYGSVFEITTSGALTSLYSFCVQGPPCADGYGPVAGLVQDTNGYLYGTTEFGGSTDSGTINPFGTVFKITPSGTLTTLDSLGVDDASAPEPTAGLVRASNGDLYGTTTGGGGNGDGTVFKITAAGKLTTLFNFCGAPSCGVGQPTDADGFAPVAGLIQATNGDLYGTTTGGGANRGNQVNGGTVFKITLGGTLTTLYSFCAQINCTDGLNPIGPLVQAANGNFYGTTVYGGANTTCIAGCGTIFEITPTGALTTLYSFCSQPNCADGEPGGNPTALIQGSDGNLYGTTANGGNNNNGNSSCFLSYGCGTIFQITPGGTLTTLYDLCSQSGCLDGATPQGGLVQDTNGTFYGPTSLGGGGGAGTVFSLSVGLSPFVEIQTASGNVGAAVTILGTDLTGATSLAFNGMAAAFTVVSSSEITTMVPAGATTGFVTVATTSGTLTSKVPFLVGAKLITNTTTLSSSPNPSADGEAVTFTAVIASDAGVPPDGETVSFMKGTTVLGMGTLSSGSASFTTSTLHVGTTSIKAVYAGDAYFKDSKSSVVRQVVN
jgi:uncharacterized repeat protein (TIGR03803 family)